MRRATISSPRDARNGRPAVGKNIELDLANAAVELLRERFVLVVQAFPG